MKKLNLELESLTVETFDAQPEDAMAPGTVHGADSPSWAEPSLCASYDEETCFGASCRRACTWQTCFPSCETDGCNC